MEKIMNFWNSLSIKGKIVVAIAAFCVAGPFGLIAISLIYSKAETDRFNEVLNNPTEENVTDFMERLHGINNHPDSWAKYRGLWNVINRSDKVTTATKEKFLAKLLKIGLHLNNTRINDNYKPDIEQPDFMQEETNRQFDEQAMEESRKAVTPFDHGGYVQGDGFNPSDTMAADAQRQMDNMNNMNNMNM